MTTLHSTIIDFRFRQYSCFNPKSGKNQKNYADFETIDAPKIEEIIYEEEQTFSMNGILVESKFDTDEELSKQKNRLIKQFMQRPSLWLPTNTMEYLFYNDFGELSINEEHVKQLSNDFTNIMKEVYEELQIKYEKAVNQIL